PGTDCAAQPAKPSPKRLIADYEHVSGAPGAEEVARRLACSACGRDHACGEFVRPAVERRIPAVRCGTAGSALLYWANGLHQASDAGPVWRGLRAVIQKLAGRPR